MEAAIAWTVLVLGYVLPLIHVSFSKAIQPARMDGHASSCPFPPRAGWIVLVLFLGPIGWLMFITSRKRARAGAAAAAQGGATAERAAAAAGETSGS